MSLMRKCLSAVKLSNIPALVDLSGESDVLEKWEEYVRAWPVHHAAEYVADTFTATTFCSRNNTLPQQSTPVVMISASFSGSPCTAEGRWLMYGRFSWCRRNREFSSTKHSVSKLAPTSATFAASPTAGASLEPLKAEITVAAPLHGMGRTKNIIHRRRFLLSKLAERGTYGKQYISRACKTARGR